MLGAGLTALALPRMSFWVFGWFGLVPCFFAAGLKPIVEVQFADYIWPALNQLFTEVSRSCYLTNGKWPVSCILRVPIGVPAIFFRGNICIVSESTSADRFREIFTKLSSK
jgi:hypothetical protein